MTQLVPTQQMAESQGARLGKCPTARRSAPWERAWVAVLGSSFHAWRLELPLNLEESGGQASGELLEGQATRQ